MKPLSLISLGVAFAMSAPLCAQTQMPTIGKLHRSTSPTPVHYSLSEGVLPSSQAYGRSGPETIFDNTGGAEYYFTTINPTEEFIDAGAFAARDLDGFEQINGFDFGYCVLPSAGASVDLEVRFYNDCVFGAGPTNWSAGPQCLYGLAGLPGIVGGNTCWQANVDLDGGFECTLPQETVPGGITDFFGVGYTYLTLDAGPILDSMYGPGGHYTATPGYGAENYFEYFVPSLPNPYLGTFWFSGSKSQASFDLKLYGDGIIDTKVVNHPMPDLGDTLRLKSDVAFRSGSQVTFTLDNATAGIFGLVFATSLATTPSVIGSNVTLLLDASSALSPPGLVLMSGAPSATYTTPSLPGLPPTVFVQAFEFSGPPFSPASVIAGSNALKMDN